MPEAESGGVRRSGKGEDSSQAGPSSDGKASAADSAPLLGKRGSDAGSAAADGVGEQPVVRTPLALPCGHRFCSPCISRCATIRSVVATAFSELCV